MRYRDVARKLATLGCTEFPRTGGGSHPEVDEPGHVAAAVDGGSGLGREGSEARHRPGSRAATGAGLAGVFSSVSVRITGA
jgi:hypothetical protein